MDIVVYFDSGKTGLSPKTAARHAARAARDANKKPAGQATAGFVSSSRLRG
jgi:hypothetical protein